MKDFYDVLELPRGLSKDDYASKYSELKAKYSEDMFLHGEEGNVAAKKLTDLESAYTQICADLDRQEINENFGSDFGQIDTLIKEGKYDDAQYNLDRLMTRDAEWHYYQSVIFYKRDWMAECRKHLVIAVNMQPDNPKYRQSLEKLDIKMANPNIPPEQFAAQQFNEGQKQRMCGNDLANCCAAYLCVDCCCTLTQCC